MELMFTEDNFLIKTLSTHEEVEAAFHLRHKVFSEELKWVPASQDGIETDRYDGFAKYIGVFDFNQQLVGHARLILSPHPFMIEKEFACMLTGDESINKGADAAEITRLCVRKEDRQNRYLTKISQLLYKGIYLWSIMSEVRHLLMVVEKRYFRLLRLNGFPVEAYNNFLTMPDGVKAAVIRLDWRNFENKAQEYKPDFLEWISKLPAPDPLQAQSHGLY
ncbi:MAG: hypothetical protein BMS9Abin23_0948 [Thermodesulfobacteriota bacterium]|nr:MAG: hypothetical protein BMS9Abin23_0948 [Thermodesulfobacteriota bacterium]